MKTRRRNRHHTKRKTRRRRRNRRKIRRSHRRKRRRRTRKTLRKGAGWEKRVWGTRKYTSPSYKAYKNVTLPIRKPKKFFMGTIPRTAQNIKDNIVNKATNNPITRWRKRRKEKREWDARHPERAKQQQKQGRQAKRAWAQRTVPIETGEW